MSILQRHRPRESKLIANKHRILNRIFRERSCSRLYLARRLNINASTVGNYVEGFLRDGVLSEDHDGPTRRGRSPVPVWLNPDYGRFLGVDLEALRVRTVLTDFAGEVVAQKEVGLRAGLGREAVLEIVLDAAKQTAKEAGDRRLFAVGVAAPGRLDLSAGRIVRYDLLPDFNDVPLLDHFRPHFDCPIYIEENIRALTLAELLRGIGRGHRHFLCLAARSGFGMGIVIDGRIYTGNRAMAGKVGRTAFPRDGRAWTMTELVSAKGIARRAVLALKSARKTPVRRALLEKADDLSLADLVAAADGDRLIRGLLEQVGADLGLVTANLANLFAPEKIILAGEVPSCCPLVREALEEWFRRHTVPEILQDIVLVDGSLSGFAAAMGAAYLGFLKTFPEDETVPAANGRSPVLAAGG
jgi:predicted NBD/HSP70 family sugar kinase